MPAYNKKEMIEFLRNRECDVKFIKANGEERLMNCTLKEDMIPSDQMPKTDGNSKSTNDNLVIAFDLGIKAWRSFNVDRVNSFTIR